MYLSQPNRFVMATAKKQPVVPLTVAGKLRAQPTAPKVAATKSHAPKPGIMLGLYKDRLHIAPDFFEPHEVPPGVKKKAA